MQPNIKQFSLEKIKKRKKRKRVCSENAVMRQRVDKEREDNQMMLDIKSEQR